MFEFTRQEWEDLPRFECLLSSGQRVYRKDENTWQELKKYCENNKIYIVEMLFGFRDNIVHLPSNQEGYFYRNMAMGRCGLDRHNKIPLMHFFVVGIVNNGNLYTTEYKVPEMQIWDYEKRTIDECMDSIIWKNQ